MSNAKDNSVNPEEGTVFTYAYRIERNEHHNMMPKRRDYLRQDEGCCCACVRHRGSIPDARPKGDSVNQA